MVQKDHAPVMITDIILPQGLRRIGASAFENCGALERIELPDTVEAIGTCAFGGFTNLTSAKLPDSLETIGSFAFAYCDHLPNKLRKRKYRGKIRTGKPYSGVVYISSMAIKKRIAIPGNALLRYFTAEASGPKKSRRASRYCSGATR